MINQELNEINYTIDDLTRGAQFRYNQSISIHEYFVLYLKAVFNEVPHQYLHSSISLVSGTNTNFFTIHFEVDADCQIPTAQRLIFVFLSFLEEKFPPNYRFTTIEVKWT